MWTGMPWPLVLGAIKEVDEGDREVIITAEVVVMEHLGDVVEGTATDTITSRRRITGNSNNRLNNGGISRHNNNNSSSSSSSNHSTGSNYPHSTGSNIPTSIGGNSSLSRNKRSNIAKGADSSDIGRRIAWHPYQVHAINVDRSATSTTNVGHQCCLIIQQKPHHVSASTSRSRLVETCPVHIDFRALGRSWRPSTSAFGLCRA